MDSHDAVREKLENGGRSMNELEKKKLEWLKDTQYWRHGKGEKEMNEAVREKLEREGGKE